MAHAEDRDVDGVFRPVPHSGLGIASFVLALAVGAIQFVLVAMAVLHQPLPGLHSAIPLSLSLCGGTLLDALAIALAIVGLRQAQRKRRYAVLGLLISVVMLVGQCGLGAVGAAKN
jgi:hypothetical protein